MKSILVFIISITFCTSGFCKSKLVQVENELKNATYLDYVVIQKYEDQKIWFNELILTDKTLFAIYSVSCNYFFNSKQCY